MRNTARRSWWVLIVILAGLSWFIVTPSHDQTSPPYPPSSVIADITFDWSTHDRRAQGSDNWPITWADDNHQYTSWGDGGGFGGTNRDGRVSLGIARVEAGINEYRGINVWGGKEPENKATFGGKSYGIISLDGILYMWVSPGSNANNYEEARIYESANRGASWRAAEWAFAKRDGMILPTFLQFGKDYHGARDQFVYIYASSFKGKIFGMGDKLRIQRPGQISLIRTPRKHVMDRRSYEFFRGVDVKGNPLWTKDPENRRPVFQDPNGVGWTVSVSHNRGIGRYLLITEHTESSAGNIGIFDGPHPWGPWTTALYANAFGESQIQPTSFFWNFSNKWSSADGKDFTLVFTGTKSNDSWNTVRGAFSLIQGVGGAPL